MTAPFAPLGGGSPSDAISRVHRLTPAQIAVLVMVAQQYTSKEIAASLGISPHTVDQRIRAALSLLGVDRRVEAARLVIQQHPDAASMMPGIAGRQGDSAGHPRHDEPVPATVPIPLAGAPGVCPSCAPSDTAATAGTASTAPPPLDGDAAPSQRLIYQPSGLAGGDEAAHPDLATGIQIRHAGCAGEADAGTALTEHGPAAPSLLVWPIATRAMPRNRMSIPQRLLWIVLIALGAGLAAGMFLAGLESLARLLGS